MKIVIIGNGISGITVARHIRKLSEHEILVISSESDHFFSRTALMKYEHTKPYEDWFWEKNRINLKNTHIHQIDFLKKILIANNQEEITYDKLIIATGSKPNHFAWPGQNLKGAQGLYSIQDLELMEENTANIKEAVIVGGGLIGIEMAEMLISRNIKVNFLIREKSYWQNVLPQEESLLVEKHIAEHHIHLMPETELQEIIGDENGRVKNIITKNGKSIDCQFVGIAVGVAPNIDFLKSSALETDKGILVNDYLETNQPNVYALGDCAQFIKPKENQAAIEQLWYTGKLQAETLAKTICTTKTKYERGIWFNSAKFLDIEYQTYGLMLNKPSSDEESFYWEHPKGKICMRVNFTKTDGSLRGFNFFGIRFRQVIAEKWIAENTSIAFCMANLNIGFFDPEFQKNHHAEILSSFNEQFPQHFVAVKKKKFFLF
jgi:NAD(P)H-nitrite reductase large subunit